MRKLSVPSKKCVVVIVVVVVVIVIIVVITIIRNFLKYVFSIIGNAVALS